ncbi:unnamed protein product [Zymoseptoria tritici ST99CH_3D1]|nr:unnamed protein product [Zymoseptoria tritici ST99CH_3D1]
MARKHVSTKPPPSSSPSSSSSLRESAAELARLDAYAADADQGAEALKLYRTQWHALQTSRITSSITDKLSDHTKQKLESHFDSIYLRHKCDRNLSSCIAWLLSRACLWHQQLGGVLGVYALLGPDGVSRTFVRAFRSLAELRSRNGVGLSLERALALMDKESALRQSGQAAVKTARRYLEWQPLDCTAAESRAVAEDGMCGLPRKTRSQKAEGCDDAEKSAGAKGSTGSEGGGGHEDAVEDEDHDQSAHDDSMSERSLEHGRGAPGASGPHADEDRSTGWNSAEEGTDFNVDFDDDILHPEDNLWPETGTELDASAHAALSEDGRSARAARENQGLAYFRATPEKATSRFVASSNNAHDHAYYDTYDDRHIRPAVHGPSNHSVNMPPHKRYLEPCDDVEKSSAVEPDQAVTDFLRSHSTLDQRIALARRFISIFCGPEDVSIDGSIPSIPHSELSKQCVAIHHKTKRPWLTALVPLLDSASDEARIWCVVEIDIGELKPIIHTSASTSGAKDRGISELIASLLAQIGVPNPPTCAKTTRGDVMPVGAGADPTGFLACLAIAVSLVAGCTPPSTMIAPLWISAIEASQLSSEQRRISSLSGLAQIPEYALTRPNKIQKLYTIPPSTKSSKSLARAIDECKSQVEDLACRLSSTEAHVACAKHIGECVSQALGKRPPEGEGGKEMELFLESEINTKEELKLKAEVGKGLHGLLSQQLAELKVKLEDLRRSSSSADAKRLECFVDMAVGDSERKCKAARQDRDQALEDMTTALRGGLEWVESYT